MVAKPICSIYVKELFEQGSENGKAELHTQKYRVVSTDKTYHGEIQIGVTFTANVRWFSLIPIYRN